MPEGSPPPTKPRKTKLRISPQGGGGGVLTPQRTISETVSGSVAANERKGFGALLNRLEATDVLIVTKLDRLGRNAMDVRATVERLDAMGVMVHCLALGGVDLTSPAGKMNMQDIVAMAVSNRVGAG